MKKLQLWLEDSTLCVELPGTGVHSHVIRLPDGEWHRLFELLRFRQPTTKIAEPGDPTNHQIAQAIKASKVKPRRVGKRQVEMSSDQRSKIDEILREMGIA